MIGVMTKNRRSFFYPGEDARPARTTKLRLDGATKRAVDTGRSRLMVTAGLFGLAFAGVAGRLVDLMVLDGTMAGNTAVTSAKSVTAPTPLHRAEILDRNGLLIATNLPTVNLFADGAKLKDVKLAAEKLVSALPGLSYDDVLHRLSSGGRFIYLRRHLTPSEQMAVNRLGIPGVYFEDSERRTYPHGALFAHIIGSTDTDNRGNAGLEKTFDERLRTQEEPLKLALDMRVQYAVRETLAEGIAKFQAVAGSAVVMDANTGELISLVSLPDFDPKSPGTASDDARFNRTTLGLYEMGSTFKLFTTAMALDAGTATLNSRYDASVPIKIGRFTITDYRGQNRWLTTPEVLVHSSNIAAGKMALEAGTEMQKAFMGKMGLLAPVAIEVPEVGTPQYPRTWRDINTITISYGHGISVTPVHVVTAVSSLVNGGVLHQPTLLHRDPAQTWNSQRVISEKTSDTMRALMRLIVLEGSGKQADAKGYLVGGKTGSAEKVSRRGGYTEHSLRTSFVSAFPIDNPQYVVLVILDEPKGTKATYNFATAGWNAAPTAGAIIAKIAPMLDVFPVGHSDDFKPMGALLATYHSTPSGNKEYYAALANKPQPAIATAQAAPALVRAVLPDNGEADKTMQLEDSDSIGALIDTIGGDGEIE